MGKQSLALLAILCASTAAGTTSNARLSGIAQGAVDRGFPAVVLLVDDGKGHIGRAACGYSDLAARRPADIDDAFHLASVGKLFTAVAAIQLADRGLLDLDGRIIEVLGAEKLAGIPHAEQITVRQLLDHSSGLYAFNNNAEYLKTLIGERASDNVVWKPEELLALAREPDNAPLGRPGSGHHYSDTNYVLLGMIVEKVAGKPFKQHVRESIFDPLGMRATWFYSDFYRRPTPVYLSHGHMVVSEELNAAVKIDPRLPEVGNGMIDTTWAGERLDASAGIVATARDLHRFSRALFDGKLLSAQNQRWLMSVADRADKLNPGKDRQAVLRAFNMPYGVSITMNGDGPNVNSVVAFEPATDAIVIVFTNIFGRWDENDIIRETIVPAALKAADEGPLRDEKPDACKVASISRN